MRLLPDLSVKYWNRSATTVHLSRWAVVSSHAAHVDLVDVDDGLVSVLTDAVHGIACKGMGRRVGSDTDRVRRSLARQVPECGDFDGRVPITDVLVRRENDSGRVTELRVISSHDRRVIGVFGNIVDACE